MSEYKTFPFMEVMNALKDLRLQYENGRPLVWNGPDDLHFAVSATTPPPSWFFTDEGKEYALENDFDFWDIYTMISFWLGFHNGTVKEEENSDFWRRAAGRSDDLVDHLLERQKK